MKLNTNVVIGFRNIGDSRDQGEIFEGRLEDAMAWLITEHLGKKSIARRFSIQIGNNHDIVSQALEIRGDATKRRHNKLMDMLRNIDSGDDDSLEESGSQTAERSGSDRRKNPLDDWQG